MNGVVQGVVEQISQRGKATNCKVNGQWYGCGFNGVPFGQGDTVSFTAVQNGNFINADMNTVQILQRNAGGAGNAPQQGQPTNSQNYGQGNAGGAGNSAGSGGNRGGGRPARSGGFRKDLNDPVQVSITQQSARNAAIQFVETALKHDCCPLPTKKAEKFDALLDLVSDVEQQFYKKTVAVAKAGGYAEDAQETPPAEQVAVNSTQGGAAPNNDFDDEIPF